MYLKNKSSNANSTHLKKESSTLGFPPSSCWLGPCGQQVQASAAHGHWGHPRAGAGGWMDHPHVLRCLAQPRLGVGLAQQSGPRLDLVPWPQVRNCPATGGATAGRSDWHRGSAGTPNSSKYQRGEEKNQQRGCQILRSPIYTAPDPDKSSFLWEEWPEKQVT